MNSVEPNNELKQWLQKAQAGDEQAFSLLHEKCYTPIYRYVYYRVKSKEIAEEIIQELFLKVFKRLDAKKGFGDKPLNYFYTMARNAVIDHWRQNKLITTEEPVENYWSLEDKSVGPHERAEINDMTEIIKKHLGRLSSGEGEAISLKFLSGLSNKEIAELLNKSVESVRQLQCRGLKKLRQKLKASNII